MIDLLPRPVGLEREKQRHATSNGCIITMSRAHRITRRSSAHESFDSLNARFPGEENLMAKDLVLQLRYLGVIPQEGHREYGFRIENKDKEIRQVVLTIDDDLFHRNQLMFQEAPDLCYQKVLTDLGKEPAGESDWSILAVTASDVAHYRESHPTAKSRNKATPKRPEHQ